MRKDFEAEQPFC